MAIVMEDADVMRARINSRPLSVLEACAGMSGSYAVFRDIGYSIDKWHTIEKEEIPNAVAEKLYAGRVRCVAGDVSEYSCRQWYDVFLAGPPCQPWSKKAGAAAMGFRDYRAEQFRQCCRILAELLEVNADAVFMFENVVVAPHLKNDEEEQERLLNWEFETINAMDMGAPQSRPRRVAQNLVEVDE
jgi:site-specific DNA-cytosine methylase